MYWTKNLKKFFRWEKAHPSIHMRVSTYARTCLNVNVQALSISQKAKTKKQGYDRWIWLCKEKYTPFALASVPPHGPECALLPCLLVWTKVSGSLI